MGNLEPIEKKDVVLPGERVDQPVNRDSAIEGLDNGGSFILEEVPAQSENAKEGAEQNSFNEILSKIPSGNAVLSSVSAAAVQDDVKQVNSADTVQAKIDTLVKLATAKGVVHAVAVARKMQDNYTLDELHDKLLAADLHDALVKSGLIKEL